MSPRDLLERLGLGATAPDMRFGWRIVAAVLAIYAVSFAVFYPQVATNDDEARYIRQAQMILAGTARLPKIDPLTGATTELQPSNFPVGTGLLMAPFVWLGGWRAAYVGPLLWILIGVGVTARWLQDEGRSPVFALLMMSFPAALVGGRVPMSDVASLVIVSIGLWLFWRGLDRGTGYWLASGFLAGASTCFREANTLLFAPFFAGAVLRRETKAWALVAGGLAGLAMRPLSGWLFFGQVLYYKNPFGWGLEYALRHLALHTAGLLVFVPAGLLLVALYRGRRRPELVFTVFFFFFFHLFHRDDAINSGLAKQLVITLRYYVPLLPLFALAGAEVIPRLWRRFAPVGATAFRAEAIAALVAIFWIAGVATIAGAVHFTLYRWASAQAEIRDAIEQYVAHDDVLVSNGSATKKFIRELERPYLPVHRMFVTNEKAASMVERYGGFYVALLDRSDSTYWRNDAQENEAFIEGLRPAPRLELDLRATPTDRLRIWRVGSARPRMAADPG